MQRTGCFVFILIEFMDLGNAHKNIEISCFNKSQNRTCTLCTCVVAFFAYRRGEEMPRALWCLKLIEDGYAMIDAAKTANTFFCADGKIISL